MRRCGLVGLFCATCAITLIALFVLAAVNP